LPTRVPPSPSSTAEVGVSSSWDIGKRGGGEGGAFPLLQDGMWRAGARDTNV
jgi:hypothetical protein